MRNYSCELFGALIIGCLVTLISFPSFAQDQLPKGDFFEKDFATRPNGIGEKEKASKKGDSKREEPSKPVVMDGDPQESDQEDPTKNAFDHFDGKIQKDDIKSPSGSEMESNGKPVFYVGAILNGLEAESFFKELEGYTTALSAKNIPSGLVYVIGSNEIEVPDDLYSGVVNRGGAFRYGFELAKKYEQVKSTPTWIVGLADGEVLLEGLGDLKQFFNSKSEYLGEKAGAPL
jgi:hypothetical protein